MKSHSTFTGRQIGRHVLAALCVIVALVASVSAQSALGTAPNATAANWKTYKYPVGLSLRYPGDWTVQEVPGFIQLISPEVQKSAQSVGKISACCCLLMSDNGVYVGGTRSGDTHPWLARFVEASSRASPGR